MNNQGGVPGAGWALCLVVVGIIGAMLVVVGLVAPGLDWVRGLPGSSPAQDTLVRLLAGLVSSLWFFFLLVGVAILLVGLAAAAARGGRHGG